MRSSFPKIEAGLHPFEIARRTAQDGEYLELISRDVAGVVLAEYLLQLFIQRPELASPELRPMVSLGHPFMDEVRSYLPDAMLHVAGEVVDHKSHSPKPVVTESLVGRVPAVVLEELNVVRAAV